MGTIIDFLSGKKTYLLVIAYAVLVITGYGNGQPLDEATQGLDLQGLTLAGAIAALRAGIAKVSG